MTGKQLVKKMRKDGWVVMRIEGSHYIMRKDGKSIPVPVHANTDLRPGTLNSILKEAGYK